METFVMLSVVLAIAILPFVVGNMLGNRLRMPDYGWKIGLILFTLVASTVVTVWGWQAGRIKRGIDLSGGVIMIYDINARTADYTVDKLIAALTLRVNPGGVKEVQIRPFGKDEIEIIIPEVDEAEADRIERIISSTGKLEFRILADHRKDDKVIEEATSKDVRELRDAKGEWIAQWVPVLESQASSLSGRGYDGIGKRIREDGGKKRLEVLVLNDDFNVKGEYLTTNKAGMDRSGRPAVNFSFNSRGAELFGELTGRHLPEQGGEFDYKLAIILDGQIYSAPSIRATITDHGEITGNFTEQQVQDLVNVLNAGALPATLSTKPISKLVIGPTLGRDTIESATRAILLASILVPLFMIWYYRFSGLVANLALIINIMSIVAIMITIKAAFTLAGLAGLALTIGMAVDNNVLVYERLREERERGATIRMAIRNAFQRASAVIIDSNVTTLIAALVLYIIGSDQVRGFAVTLFLGVSLSMFTSVWMARVVFDVCERQKWLTKLKMLRLIGVPSIDFMRLFPITATASAVVVVLGLIGTFFRGQGILDIDFTGGTSVIMVFNDPQTPAYVREVVTDQAKLPDVVVTDIRGEGEGKQFMLNTSEQSLPEVEAALVRVFGEKLTTNGAQLDELKPILAEKSSAEKDDAAKSDEKKAEDTTADDTKADDKEAEAKKAEDKKAADKKAEADKELADRFAGGATGKLKLTRGLNRDNLREAFAKAMKSAGVVDPGVTEFSNADYSEGSSLPYDQWTVRSRLSEAELGKVVATMNENLGKSPYFPSSSTIGSAVAAKTQVQASYALVASWACMLVYLWIRFQGVAFGLAAVVSLVHDVFTMLAGIALSYWLAGPLGFMLVAPFKINLTMIAAFLTIIGYSVNDTIVVFDRIREVRGKMPGITPQMVNQSVNETLSRTIITAFTVFLVCVVLYFLGGDALRGFAFALTIGVVTGCYSSVYVAAPVLLWLVKPRGETLASLHASHSEAEVAK